MSDRKERRLGHVLLHALTLACVQRDIDAARRLEVVLEAEKRRRGPNAFERRKQWPTAVERAHEHVRALERSIRRCQTAPPPHERRAETGVGAAAKEPATAVH